MKNYFRFSFFISFIFIHLFFINACEKETIPDIAGTIQYRIDASNVTYQVELLDNSYHTIPVWIDDSWQIETDEMTNQIVYIITEVWHTNFEDCELISKMNEKPMLKTNSIGLIHSILSHADESEDTNFAVEIYNISTNVAQKLDLDGFLKLGEYWESFKLLEKIKGGESNWITLISNSNNEEIIFYRLVKRYGVDYDKMISNLIDAVELSLDNASGDFSNQYSLLLNSLSSEIE